MLSKFLFKCFTLLMIWGPIAVVLAPDSFVKDSADEKASFTEVQFRKSVKEIRTTVRRMWRRSLYRLTKEGEFPARQNCVERQLEKDCDTLRFLVFGKRKK